MFARHRTKISCIVLMILAVSGIALEAQTTVTGYVRDAYTHHSLQGVVVRLIDPLSDTSTSLTDSTGKFIFENVNSGRYLISAVFANYQEARILNYLIGRINIPIAIELEPEIKDLPEVVITDRSTGDYLHPLSNRLLVSREQTERLPAGFFDPARLFSLQAGVSPLNDAANHLVIRGNNPAFVKWMIHGTEIVNPNHLSNAGTFSDQASASGGGVNMVSASVLENTYLIKAPYSAGVGNALAGIIDLNLRPGRVDKLSAEAQISLLGMEAGLEGPISVSAGSSFILRYRYSTVGLLSALGAQFGDENINYQDIMGHVHFPSRKSDFSLYFFTGNNQNLYEGIQDSSRRSIDKETRDIEFSGAQTIAGMSHEWRLNSQNRWVNDLIYSQLNSSRSFGPAGSETLLNQNHLEQEKWSFHSRLITAMHDNAVLTAGFQFQSNTDRASYRGDSPPPGPACCPDPYLSIQPYINYSIQLKRLTIQPGIHSMFAKSATIEPRLQALYRLSPGQSLHLHLGKYSQLASPISYYPEVTRVPIPSYQFQLGFQNAREKSEWGASVFYQYHLKVPSGGEFYSLINDSPFESGAILASKAKGRVYGIESSFSILMSDWRWSSNLTLFNSRLITPSGKTFSSRFDQKYLFHTGIGREWLKNKPQAKRLIGFHTQWSYGGALRDTPIDEQASIRNGRPVYQSDRLNSIKRPDLYRLDLRVYKRKLYKHMNTLLALDIQNLTGKKNFAFSYFDYVQRKTLVNYQLGILPNLSFTIEY